MRINNSKPYEDTALLGKSAHLGANSSGKTAHSRANCDKPRVGTLDSISCDVSLKLTIPEEEIRSHLVEEARKAIADGTFDTPQAIARAAENIMQQGL